MDDYTLTVTVAGQGVLGLFDRRLSAENGETLDEPPRVTATRFRLAAADLAYLQTLLFEAHIARQQDCHSSVQFFAAISTALPPKQRLVWFGNARRHEFEAWHGSECSDEVVALLSYLAGVAEAAYELPQER